MVPFLYCTPIIRKAGSAPENGLLNDSKANSRPNSSSTSSSSCCFSSNSSSSSLSYSNKISIKGGKCFI